MSWLPCYIMAVLVNLWKVVLGWTYNSRREQQPAGGHWGCRGGTHGACIVDELKVGLRTLALASSLWFEEVAGLSQVVVIQGCLECGISGLGEDTLFFQDGEDSHGLQEKRMALEQPTGSHRGHSDVGGVPHSPM